MRPWNAIPIDESGEGLKALPFPLIRLEPHPYAALGAPYGPSADPFRLRSGVVERLLQAQMLLVDCSPDLGLGIFDAWRPIAVQAFMVEHTIQTLCLERGIDREDPAQSGAIDAVISDVGRFWATPSRDPAMPPPHSTGAAVDLTLVDASQGLPLDMGGAIDAIGAVSEPDHYATATDPRGRTAHQRRCLLRDVMQQAGFQQHPNEWWHFSHGDQLWAWRAGESSAIYAEAPISSVTA